MKLLSSGRSRLLRLATLHTNERERRRGAFCSARKPEYKSFRSVRPIPSILINHRALGVPLRHLVNLGNKTEKYYGLLPQAEADYYLWVDARTQTQAQWTLLQLSHVTHTVTAALPTDLNYCHQAKYVVTAPDADFAKNRPEGRCNVPIRR